METTRWFKDNGNDGRWCYEIAHWYEDRGWTYEGDILKGTRHHVDEVTDSLYNMLWLLCRLDVIWAYDSGEGEPAIWLK